MIRLRIRRPAGSDLDLTTAESCTAELTRPSGSKRTWNLLIDEASEDVLVLSYVFAADGSDLPDAGTYRLRPRVVFSDAAVRRANPIDIIVRKW
jgi:hypothetical protein